MNIFYIVKINIVQCSPNRERLCLMCITMWVKMKFVGAKNIVLSVINND